MYSIYQAYHAKAERGENNKETWEILFPVRSLSEREEDNSNGTLQASMAAGNRMKKRTWVYAMQPNLFEIVCMLCKSSNITWSEFEGCIYCYNCETDNVGYGGIFTGPIPVNALGLLGLSLDRIHLKSRKRLKLVTIDNNSEYMMQIY
ncbi:hypothetical protein LCGC14_1544910 [marine sediment metagenome]|uniref:Uncharacterized protein n=1 Tax=marine sediment metagenome TaxID=412755 RepID=A0A0F9LSQ5_9ZZZZ